MLDLLDSAEKIAGLWGWPILPALTTYFVVSYKLFSSSRVKEYPLGFLLSTSAGVIAIYFGFQSRLAAIMELAAVTAVLAVYTAIYLCVAMPKIWLRAVSAAAIVCGAALLHAGVDYSSAVWPRVATALVLGGAILHLPAVLYALRRQPQSQPSS